MAKGMYIGAKISGHLVNLLPAVNSSNFTTGVNSNTHIKYADVSLKLVSSANRYETLAETRLSYPYDLSHKYYIRYEVYMETQPDDALTFGCYFPLLEPCFFAGMRPVAGQWTMFSNAGNLNVPTTYDTSSTFRIDMDNWYVEATAWIDGAMLIDLTDAFGSGNEPSKEWCDANIDYFLGSKYIEVENTSPVARKVKYQYIGVDNVARKVKKGYIGVSNVARNYFE